MLRIFSLMVILFSLAWSVSAQERGDDTSSQRETELRTALSTAEKTPAKEAELAKARFELGRLLLDTGRLTDAEPLLLKAFEYQSQKVGADKLDTLVTNAHLVRLFKAKGDAAKSKEYGEKFEAGMKNRPAGIVSRQLRGLLDKEVAKAGPAPASTTPSPTPATTPAPVTQAKPTVDPAEQKARDNLAAAEKALGAEHPETLTAALELGVWLMEKGRVDEAESFVKRALDGRAKVAALGQPHAEALIEMSRLLAAKDNKQGAAELGTLALSLLERSLGKDQAKLTAAKSRLANIPKRISPASATASTTAATSSPSSPASASATASAVRTYDPAWAKALRWRTIGPTAMGGRVVDIAVVESDPTVWFVASASGGLFKTTNCGTSFEILFDKENTVSIGAIAVAQSNPNIVWVGTGEQNARNSASWGDGVYKSIDGGKTWTNMGLTKSFQIGKILVHPKNPDVVYVGALGRLWGENEERGIYKTIDGGKTWNKVLHIDSKTGCIDMVAKPDDPETIIAAMYERQRDNTDANDPIKRWGPGSGIYKTTDGGRKWTKLTKGLPTVALGRVGFSWYRANPNVVFAIVESERSGDNPSGGQGPAPAGNQPAGQGGAQRRPGSGYMGIQGEDAIEGAGLIQIVDGGPAAAAGLKENDIVTAVGGKPVKSYEALLAIVGEASAGDKLKLDVKRGDQKIAVEVTLGQRPAGGGGGRGGAPAGKPFGTSLGGQVQNVQDRQGPEGFQTGGVYRSADAGETWTRVNSLTPRPFYFSKIAVDPKDEKNVYVLGIQLHTSKDGGKTFDSAGGRNVHADHHAIWINPADPRHIVLGCDGGLYVTHDQMKNWDFLNHLPMAQFYHVAVDNRIPYRVYGGLQDNQSWGSPSALRGRSGPQYFDWINLGGGDGFVCAVDADDPDLVYFESQNGAMSRVNLRTGQSAFLRPQLPGGPQTQQRGARTGQRGPQTGQAARRFRFNWKTPFILSSHNTKIFYAAGNVVFRSINQGDDLKPISPEITNTNTGSATAIAESPVDSEVLYVGTDDGALWMTRDGGKNWTDLKQNLKGLVPSHFWVDTLECSRFQAGRVYAAFDCHRGDNDEPFPAVSEDYGKTWKIIRGNLPSGSTRTLREDRTDENILYCGTEFGLWVSVDRGKDWTKITGLPTVAVHEVAQPTTAEELVVATHGRGMWILELPPVRQATAKVLSADVHLFKPAPAYLWNQNLQTSQYGVRRFVGENPTTDAVIYYSLRRKAEKLTVKVVDANGQAIRDLTAPKEAGLNRVTWDRRRPINPVAGMVQMFGGGGGRGGARGRGTFVSPGTYRVVLNVDGKEFSQAIEVRPDPEQPISPAALDVLEERLDAIEEQRFQSQERMDERID